MINDMIYRREAIEALTGWETDPTDEEIEYALNNLKSAGGTITNLHCDNADINCDECDYHRSVLWCARAIPCHSIDIKREPIYHEGFSDGLETADKELTFMKELLAESYRPESHWVVLKESMQTKMQCAECGHIETRFIRADNYCPKCGAKMVHNESGENGGTT